MWSSDGRPTAIVQTSARSDRYAPDNLSRRSRRVFGIFERLARRRYCDCYLNARHRISTGSCCPLPLSISAEVGRPPISRKPLLDSDRTGSLRIWAHIGDNDHNRLRLGRAGLDFLIPTGLSTPAARDRLRVRAIAIVSPVRQQRREHAGPGEVEQLPAAHARRRRCPAGD